MCEGLGGCCHLLVPSLACKPLSLSKRYLHISVKQGRFYPVFICHTVSKGRRNHRAFTTMLSTSAWALWSVDEYIFLQRLASMSPQKSNADKQQSLFASWTQKISVSSPLSKNWILKGLNYGLQILNLICLNKTSYAVLHFPHQFKKVKEK